MQAYLIKKTASGYKLDKLELYHITKFVRYPRPAHYEHNQMPVYRTDIYELAVCDNNICIYLYTVTEEH